MSGQNAPYFSFEPLDIGHAVQPLDLDTEPISDQ